MATASSDEDRILLHEKKIIFTLSSWSSPSATLLPKLQQLHLNQREKEKHKTLNQSKIGLWHTTTTYDFSFLMMVLVLSVCVCVFWKGACGLSAMQSLNNVKGLCRGGRRVCTALSKGDGPQLLSVCVHCMLHGVIYCYFLFAQVSFLKISP